MTLNFLSSLSLHTTVSSTMSNIKAIHGMWHTAGKARSKPRCQMQGPYMRTKTPTHSPSMYTYASTYINTHTRKTHNTYMHKQTNIHAIHFSLIIKKKKIRLRNSVIPSVRTTLVFAKATSHNTSPNRSSLSPYFLAGSSSYSADLMQSLCLITDPHSHTFSPRTFTIPGSYPIFS